MLTRSQLHAAGRAAAAFHLGDAVVLEHADPRTPQHLVRFGGVIEGVHREGLTIRGARRREFVGWVDLWCGHATLLETPAARAIMRAFRRRAAAVAG